MSHFCPDYPTPRKNKASKLLMFFSARRSWLNGLYERSYSMRMGEIHLPGLNLYMVNEPELVSRVLTDQLAFPKNILMGDALRPLLGDSVLTTSGQQWARQRNLMESAFANARLAVAFPSMRDAAKAMLLRLEKLADTAEHDIEIEMTHVTADIIFRTLFSSPLEGPDAERVFASFAQFQALAPKLLLPSIYGLRWLVWPWDVWRSRKAAREIRNLLTLFIKPRFEAHQTGTGQRHTDILDALLHAGSSGGYEPFNFTELVDQVAVLFLAGHETSASALTWALYLIAQSPEIQDRMHAEAMTLGTDVQVSLPDLKQLKLTRNVFRETLRLFPPVGFIARQAASSCPMRDKMIEKEASIIVSPWLIHRHRGLWKHPDAFDPDRFNDEESRVSIQKAYLPFGMGPRVCVGATFAMHEAVLLLSSLVRNYKFNAVPGHIPEPVGRLTIRSGNGVRLTLHRRTPVASITTAGALS